MPSYSSTWAFAHAVSSARNTPAYIFTFLKSCLWWAFSTEVSQPPMFLPALTSTKALISSCHCLVYGRTSLLYGISTSHCRAICISFTFSLTAAFKCAGRRCLMNTGWLLEDWIEWIPCNTAGKSPGLHPRTGLNPYLPLTSSVTRAKSFNFKKGNNRLLF